MSRHGFEYSITPSRPAGWRSFLANFLMVITVAAVSAISGAVVALELLGPDKPGAGARSTAQMRPAPLRVAQPSAPATAAPAVIELPQLRAAIVQPVPQPAAVPAPQAAPASQAAPPPHAAPAAPVQAVALADAQALAQVPESELTFTHGYARRRAVQEAANAASGTQVARVESEAQFGREALKIRPRTVARVDSRAADAREARGLFGRFDQPARYYDSSRHQAMAYGDPRTNQNRRSQGGLFGSGGFFGSLF
jgi:hypothetical protein